MRARLQTKEVKTPASQVRESSLKRPCQWLMIPFLLTQHTTCYCLWTDKKDKNVLSCDLVKKDKNVPFFDPLGINGCTTPQPSFAQWFSNSGLFLMSSTLEGLDEPRMDQSSVIKQSNCAAPLKTQVVAIHNLPSLYSVV